jgi:hypothetical protein
MRKRRNCRILQFSILLLFGLNNVHADNEHIDKWPIINDDNVNVRDYPDINKGTVLFKLYKNQKIVIWYKTNNKKEINDSINFWYYISIFDGEYKGYNGWVYGEYISFKDNYNEVYWNTTVFNIKSIDERMTYRNIVARRLREKLFGMYDESGCYDTDLLIQYGLIHQQTSFLWYMRESNFNNLNTYSTNYGNIMGFVNENSGKWRFFELTIERNIEGLEIFPGMDIKEIENIFGNDYTINDGKLEYNFNDDFDSHFWIFNVRNERIISFSITLFYD